MRRPLLPLAVTLGLLVATLAAPSAQAWVAGPDKPHHADLAVIAAERLPEPERSYVLRNVERFREGALDPDGVTDKDAQIHTFYHAYEPSDGGGGGVYRVRLSLREATVAMRDGAPEGDVAYQLGILTHFVLDLSVPFHTGKDSYDNLWHEPYEHAAYDRQGEIQLPPTRPPREVEDTGAYAVDLAERSAELVIPLVEALDASGDAGWSPEVSALTQRAQAMGVEATADLLHTAFLMAHPSRPDPAPVDGRVPVPRDAEDLGLSITEIGKHHPWLMASAVFALLAALVVVVTFVARSRHADRHH